MSTPGVPERSTSRALRLGLAGLALAALCACGSQADRIETGLRRGTEHARAGDWEKARLEVRNVLQIDPKNARAYALAGQVAEGQREVQRAYASFLKAVELDPTLVDAKVGLARIYVLAGEMAQADKTIAEILALDHDNLSARTLQAALLAKRGNVREAITQVQAMRVGPGAAPIETSLLLAGLYVQVADSARALEVIETALRAAPDNLSLLLVAAQIAGAEPVSAERAAKAVGFYRRAAEHAPRNADLWMAWAGHHLRRSETDMAEEVLRASQRAQPDDDKRRLALLDFLAAHRGHEVAEKEYLAAMADQPKDTRLRFGLAGLYRGDRRAADAQRVLESIVALDPDAPAALLARNQLAGAAIAAGQLTPARAWLSEVLKRSPRDADALVMRGHLLLGDGQARDAIIDLRAAAKDRPGSPEVVGLLAQAHRASGEPQLAREVLADAVAIKPDDPDLRLLLAADMADTKDYAAAQNELDEAIRRAPQATRAYEVKAQLALAQKDGSAAEKALVALKASHPNDGLGYLRLGQLYASQKKTAAALKEYDAATRLAPAASPPVVAAVDLLTAERRHDEAAQRIDALAQADPKNTLVHQLRGDLALARGDLDDAEAAYRQLVAAVPARAEAYQNLARVLSLRKDDAGALRAFDDGERANPGDTTIGVARAEWQTRRGHYDDAMATYERLLARSPADDTLANNLAYLLAEVKGDPASLQRALQLTARFDTSNNPGYLDSRGWVHYRLGDYASAVPLLERAVALSAGAPLLQLHLGLALHKRGEARRGSEFLRKAIDSKAKLPDLDEARRLLLARG